MSSVGSSGCRHSLRQAKRHETAYRLAVRLSVALGTEKTGYRPRCSVCNAPNVLCCLQCRHVGCRLHGTHAKGHSLGVCLWKTSEGYLFCFECGDFVYDSDFEAVRQSELHSILAPQATNTDKIGAGSVAFANLKKPCYHAMTGLRGFYNMGATCYISVILQALIHNPLVRGFFLAGGHEKGVCKRKICVQCCVDQIYCDFFGSDETEGYGVPELLQATASLTPTLTGATEQDAHEFLHFLLDQFHRSHFVDAGYALANRQAKDVVSEPVSEQAKCTCVAHRAFSGMLESTLECTCGFLKHTIDPLMDLSLEVNGSTVEECLTKFTSPERLSHYTCSSCGQRGTVTKRILIKTLPPILQIQLKRFKHAGSVFTKVESPVRFDQLLDMTQFSIGPTPSRPYIYELYGLVLHSGSLDTGHYTCIMKHSSGAWYHFDDSVVTPVDPLKLRDHHAYLLFYTIRWAV